MYNILPIRLIPVDFGYQIKDTHLDKITTYCTNNRYLAEKDIAIIGGNILLRVEVSDNLFLNLFRDGIGVFVYLDEIHYYKELQDINSSILLAERKDAHRSLLNGSHSICSTLKRIIQFIRGLASSFTRRLTSFENWEKEGLSYVMSIYYFNFSNLNINNKGVFSTIYNLLFTDTYTYHDVICENFEQEKVHYLLSNQDVISNVHVCCSWASFIVIGDNCNIDYYLNLEIALQHIWMYAYITEKNIDVMLSKDIKSYSSKDFQKFYQTIMEMNLIVKKYNSVITSTTHERENKLMSCLKETSKLNVIENSIDVKVDTLKNRMEWAISLKQLKSDRNTEIFIIFLTIIQVLTSFNLGIRDILNIRILGIVFLVLLLIIFYRKRI